MPFCKTYGMCNENSSFLMPLLLQDCNALYCSREKLFINDNIQETAVTKLISLECQNNASTRYNCVCMEVLRLSTFVSKPYCCLLKKTPQVGQIRASHIKFRNCRTSIVSPFCCKILLVLRAERSLQVSIQTGRTPEFQKPVVSLRVQNGEVC